MHYDRILLCHKMVSFLELVNRHTTMVDEITYIVPASEYLYDLICYQKEQNDEAIFNSNNKHQGAP